jgi:hypothetical protein
MRRTLIGVLIVALLFPFGITSAIAQDASPMAGECLAPEIPPGTPTPMEDMEMEMGSPPASPEAGMATPEDEMAMPPLPEPLTGGAPADDATAAEVETAVRNLESCIASGMFVEASSLYTANGLMQVCGTANPYDGEFCWSGLEITVESVENVQTYEDGSLSADVTYQFFNALQAEQFVFVREGDFLLIDAVIPLEVEIPEGATVITGELVDYEFVLDATSAPAGDIAFEVTNTGEYPHELVVMALPEGVTIDDLLEDESLFEQVQFFGFTFAEPGQDAPPAVLVDMEPGTYMVVCFVDVPEGVPHVMRGMVLEFEVTAP